MKISKIKIDKFRNITDKEYDLLDVNIFSGKNELCKTSINEFIMWLLFDYTFLNKANNDKNLNTNEDVTETYVGGSVILENGTELSREYNQVWKDNCGILVSKPSKNEFFIDKASIKTKEYKVAVLELFNFKQKTKVKDLDIARLFYDVLYMEQLSAVQFREFFAEILSLSNEDDIKLIESNKQFEKLLDPLKEQKFDIKNVISVNDNKLKALINGNPREVSIDVLKTQINELEISFNEKEYNKLVEEESALKSELEVIFENEIHFENIKTSIEEIPTLNNEIELAKNSIKELENKEVEVISRCPKCNHVLEDNEKVIKAKIEVHKSYIDINEKAIKHNSTLEFDLEEFNKGQERKQEINTRLETLKTEIFNLEVAKSNAQKLDTMKASLKSKMSEKANAEIVIALAKEFRKLRNEKVETKLSTIFGNDLVVTLREKNKFDDDYSETGYIKVGNVEYNGSNTASRYLHGLTFIEGLKRYLGVGDLPIIFDKSNDLDTSNMKKLCSITNSQIFSTKVTDEEILTNVGFDRNE